MTTAAAMATMKGPSLSESGFAARQNPAPPSTAIMLWNTKRRV
jgi:hypothetical protein